MRLTPVILALALFLISVVTVVIVGLRVFRMTQIQGWVPGARIATYTVTEKYQDRGRRLNSKTYWVRWAAPGVQDPDKLQVMLEYDNWAKLQVGSPIQITYVGDDTPYTLDNASDIDFAIDGILLFGGLVVGGFSGHYFLTQER